MSLVSRTNHFSDEQKGPARKRRQLWLRARMIQIIRNFFIERDYLEVETPQLIPAPPPEPHIEAISADGGYLHTSPELYMKRLLAAGYSRIFQITKSFRSGERGSFHLPEFTLLEWYRSQIEYKALMEECEVLMLSVSEGLGNDRKIHYQGRVISLDSPWDRIKVSEAFDRFAPIPLEMAMENGRFDEIMASDIEPNLGLERPVFLYDYPACLASLARLKAGDSRYAERFEIYIAGLELANGFSELTDPLEQKSRFERDRQERQASGKQVYPMPERFLEALEYMPEAAGIALGMDRLAMVFIDSDIIDDVVPFPPEEL